MAWLIGVDEAGYGPNLGPLVIGATAWRVGGSEPIDLYETLSAAVTVDPGGDRVAIADSKRLYKPGGGWRLLERGVLGALRAGHQDASDSAGLVASLSAELVGSGCRSPWRRDGALPLPVDATTEEVQDAGGQLAAALEQAGAGPPVLRARLVQPEEFNALVDEHGTKGAALSHVTIALLRSLIDEATSTGDDGPVFCVLDKHGGRNRYAGLIQHHFSEAWIETLAESRAESRYRAALANGAPIDLAFRTGGEAFLPTALASMTAKLLREIEMRRFNTFWRRHVPHLKPTAGYPVDAKRFKAQIASKQAELEIEDHTLWRSR